MPPPGDQWRARLITAQDHLPAILNTVAALSIAGGSILAAIRPVTAEPTGSLFAAEDTLLSADPRAFWIWWAVAVAMVPFVVWQWLPAERDSPRLVLLAWPAVTAGVAHPAWILLGQAGRIWPTTIFIVIELSALSLVVWRLAKYASHDRVENLATDIGWGLALGWVGVEVLIMFGVIGESVLGEDLWFIAAIVALCVFLAGALGLAGRLFRQFAVGVALIWGLAMIGWQRLMADPRSYVLGTMAGFGCFVIAAAFYASGRRRRRNVPGLEERPWR